MNLGSDVSIDNILQLGSADTKIDSQDAVKKVLELMEKRKYSNLEVNSKFLFKNLLET